MKRYIFENGSIGGELNGIEIKEHEKTMGKLLGVLERGQKIMCRYEAKQLPIEKYYLFRDKFKEQ